MRGRKEGRKEGSELHFEYYAHAIIAEINEVMLSLNISHMLVAIYLLRSVALHDGSIDLKPTIDQSTMPDSITRKCSFHQPDKNRLRPFPMVEMVMNGA